MTATQMAHMKGIEAFFYLKHFYNLENISNQKNLFRPTKVAKCTQKVIL